MLRMNSITLVVLGVGLSVLVGCNDGASNRAELQPSPTQDDSITAPTESTPAPQQSQPTDAAEPIEEPQKKQAVEQQAKPAPEETAKPPPIPDYLTVLERVDDHAAVNVTGQTLGRSRLVIETRNVQRLRIRRDKLAFAPGRSIALRLDDQVFELRSRTDLVEMQRSRNGEWSPVVVKKKP